MLSPHIPVHFPVDLGEGFFAVWQAVPDFIVQGMVEHIPELLASGVSICVQHLEAIVLRHELLDATS